MLSKPKKKVIGMPRLYERIRIILESARASAAREVNIAQVVANWLIGREIVEEEQAGERRALYSAELLRELATRLQAEFGAGYGVDNSELFRRFYLEYPALLTQENSDATRRNSVFVPENHPVLRAESWRPGKLNSNLSWLERELRRELRYLSAAEPPTAGVGRRRR